MSCTGKSAVVCCVNTEPPRIGFSEWNCGDRLQHPINRSSHGVLLDERELWARGDPGTFFPPTLFQIA